MRMTMAEAKSRRDPTATHDQRHGVHDYGSVGEAQAAFQNSGISHAAPDGTDQAKIAEWMWRNDASPEEAAIAFGLKLPGESG